MVGSSRNPKLRVRVAYCTAHVVELAQHWSHGPVRRPSIVLDAKRCCSGAIIFRTIQINVGFDRRGHENCIKLALNEHVRSASFAALSVKVLDIEAMTASRPETFVHEASNHFFCQCVSGFERATPMCETAACLRKRAHRFENGEAHRALAQMVLSALDAADIAS